MAQITAGIVRLTKVFQNDLFDLTLSITGIDLTGKSFLCQVKETPTSTPVLEFTEAQDSSEEGSLIATILSSSSATIRLVKTAPEMNIPVLPLTYPKTLYNFTIVMYTTLDDVQTIIEGTMDVVNQYTKVETL